VHTTGCTGGPVGLPNSTSRPSLGRSSTRSGLTALFGSNHDRLVRSPAGRRAAARQMGVVC